MIIQLIFQTYMVPRISDYPAELKASNGKTYHLPARTSVILNITAIHHNESYWPNAASFKPERFFGKSENDEMRVDASLWLYVLPLYWGDECFYLQT